MIITIQEAIGAIGMASTYSVIRKLYPKNENDSITAFSLASGEGSMEMLLQYSYLY